ncbi:Microtubule-nucleating Tub4p (gamma-tubulin) complex component [Dimargaris verticillata]|uniref:Microtubule-nucleating Tub4p (Gamma-tubulin) complex component n=1 Tax=Dimargaris verticillata TaxID=2761393 RepID=A0A9W8EB87_9FUNG|nr:Microtubule-nucleating Tub4p (gamma-tubulin) complex component [Dimargaris verticillata]
MNSDATALLEQLVDRLLSPNSEAVTPIERRKAIQYCRRILGSRVGSTIVEDETHLSGTIQKHILAQNPDQSEGQRRAVLFAQLHTKLQHHAALSKPWAILYFLYALSSKPSHNSTGQAPCHPSGPFNHGLWTHTRGLACLDNASPMPPKPASSTSQPSMAITELSTTDQTSLELSQRSSETATNASLVPLSDRLPTSPDIGEPQLIVDLLFTFQGIDGKYIRFDETRQTFQLKDKLPLSAHTAALATQLATLGGYYRQSKAFVDNKRTDATAGHIAQSLCAFLDQELTKHLEFVATLESQHTPKAAACQRPATSATDPPATPAVTNRLWSVEARSQLTLHRLRAWLVTPTKKLQFMAHLAHECQSLHGSTLLNRIHSFATHGDPFIRDFVHQLMLAVSAPFYDILEHWLFNGELLDPHMESFIITYTDVNRGVWGDKYRLNALSIPVIMPSMLAVKIFNIGKSLNFLRFHCQDHAWISEQCRIMRQDVKLQYSDSFALEVSIDRAYRAMGGRLIDVIFTKYRMMDHFEAMKRYLLLGQGDFAQCLMTSLDSELSRPATRVHKYNVTAALESAIRSSNAFYDDPVITNQLGFGLDIKTPSDLGWDAFELRYTFPAPISYFFPPATLRPYSRLFVFLWKLKSVEHQLTTLWRKLTINARTLRGLSSLRREIHHCHGVTGEMIHFVNQLQYFILYEIIEKAWTQFMHRIDKGITDLDILVSAHQHFLLSISSILVSSKHDYIRALKKLFQDILQFKAIAEQLYDYALTEKYTGRPPSAPAAMVTDAAATIGSDGLGSSSDLQSHLDPLHLAKRRMHNQSDALRKRICQLLESLDSSSEPILRHLALRINYNNHYHWNPRARSQSISHRSGKPQSLPRSHSTSSTSTPTASRSSDPSTSGLK